MLEHTDSIILDNINKTLEGDCGLFWDRPVLGLWLSLCPSFCNISEYLRSLLANTFGQNLWRIYNLRWNLVQCSSILFAFSKGMNKLNSTKNRNFISLVVPSDSCKTFLIHERLRVGTFQPKFDKTYFFYQHPHLQPLYDVMQKNW